MKLGAWRCRVYRSLEGIPGIPPWMRGRARDHRHTCDGCRRRHAEERAVAEALADMQLPPVPSARLWRRIGAGLDAPARLAGSDPRPAAEEGHEALGDGRPGRARRRLRGSDLLRATGMVVVAAAGLALGSYGAWRATPPASPPGSSLPAGGSAPAIGSPSSPGTEPRGPGRPRPDRLAVVPVHLDVDSYVDEITEERSPQGFWDAYRAADVTRDDELERLDFRPVVPEELPGGLGLVERKMLRDACCPTLQLRYRDGDRWVDLFECHADHPVSFGRASLRNISVDGLACAALEWDGVRGRSLVHRGLNLVLVGNLSDEELDAIVARLGAG